MKKNIGLIIPQRGFDYAEHEKIKKLLANYNVEITTICVTRNQAHSADGHEVAPDIAIREVEEKMFDGLIVVGAIDAYGVDQEVLSALLQRFAGRKKMIAAIDAAVLVLAEAGLLIGKTTTGPLNEAQALITRGASYTGMACEVDGMIVTARDRFAIDALVKEVAYLLAI